MQNIRQVVETFNISIPYVSKVLNSWKDRAETYSNYKGHNTAKYLVGISPHGQIMFVSRSYGGRASDKYIEEF